MSSLPAVKQFISNTGVRIYRIPCQAFDTLATRVYLLLGAGLPTLVDAGSGVGRSTDDILAGIKSVAERYGEKVRPQDVRRIIISHGHVDHIGGLTELLEAMPAQVAVHPLDQLAITSHREYVAMGNSRLRAFFQHAGVDPAVREELLKISHFIGVNIEPVEITLALNDGQTLDGLRIIHTPGHSPGHICIGIGNVLLSADHILARTVPQQWPESTAPYTGLGHYFESLEKIERMTEFELTLPAHEQPIHDLRGRIKSIRGAHMRRLDRLLNMLRHIDRAMSVREITDQIYPEMTGFRAVLAITDVGSRVEYLHQHGQLWVENIDEVETAETPVYRYRVV